MKLAVLLLFSASLWAQSAPVVVLDREDADRARELYEAKKKAETDWENFHIRLAKDYLTVPAGDPKASGYEFYEEALISGGTSGILVLNSGGSIGTFPVKAETREPRKPTRFFRSGWGGYCTTCLPTYQFSDDFRYLVPAPPSPPPQTCLPGYGGWTFTQ